MFKFKNKKVLKKLGLQNYNTFRRNPVSDDSSNRQSVVRRQHSIDFHITLFPPFFQNIFNKPPKSTQIYTLHPGHIHTTSQAPPATRADRYHLESSPPSPAAIEEPIRQCSRPPFQFCAISFHLPP